LLQLHHHQGHDPAVSVFWPYGITALLARRPYKVVAVALANKMARIIWALLVKGGRYQENGASNQMATA